MGLSLGIFNRRTEAWDYRFDSTRWSGDWEFHMWHSDLEHVESVWDQAREDGYYRPRDFAASRQWVRDNIDPAWTDNIKRLMDALDWLERDPDLWFNGSN